MPTPSTLGEVSHDSYGRMTGSFDPAMEMGWKYHNDWLTGHCHLMEVPPAPPSLLDDPPEQFSQGFNHASGYSRVTRAEVPEEWKQHFYFRGPQGQVKYVLDGDGVATNAFQFASGGNRISQDVWTASPLPWYYDHEISPFPGSMQNLTQGAAGMRERTPKAGGMDTMQPGGSAAAGSSANPDLPAPGQLGPLTQTSSGGKFEALAHRDQPMGLGFDPSRPPGSYNEILPARPPSDWHKPGSGGDLAPPQAPPTEHGEYAGMAGQADRRLSGAWGAQEYYGPKPGNQTGSRFVDDSRDYSHPLPQLTPIGGHTGPPGYHHAQPLPAYPPPGWGPPMPDFGPQPWLGNADSPKNHQGWARDKGQGNTKPSGGGGKSTSALSQASQAASSGASGDQGKSEKPGMGNLHELDDAAAEKDKQKAKNDAYQAAMDAQDPFGGSLMGRLWTALAGSSAMIGGTVGEAGGGFGIAIGTAVGAAADFASDNDVSGAINRAIPGGAATVAAVTTLVSLGTNPSTLLGKAESITNGLEHASTLGQEVLEQVPGMIERNAEEVATGAGRVSTLAENRAQGLAGEAEFASTLRGAVRSHVRIMTDFGARVIDRLHQGIAYEVKTGYRGITNTIRRQIAKDVWLRDTAGTGVSDVKWIFRPGKSGVGLTDDLARLLEEHGIGYEVQY